MDFVLVSGLVVAIVVALIQLTLALHVRNTLIDSASEGARYGALLGSSPAAGAARARELIEMTLSPRYAQSVSARTVDGPGGAVVQVDVVAPLPVLGLLGPSGVVEVSGHATLEVAGGRS